MTPPITSVLPAFGQAQRPVQPAFGRNIPAAPADRVDIRFGAKPADDEPGTGMDFDAEVAGLLEADFEKDLAGVLGGAEALGSFSTTREHVDWLAKVMLLDTTGFFPDKSEDEMPASENKMSEGVLQILIDAVYEESGNAQARLFKVKDLDSLPNDILAELVALQPDADSLEVQAAFMEYNREIFKRDCDIARLPWQDIARIMGFGEDATEEATRKAVEDPMAAEYLRARLDPYSLSWESVALGLGLNPDQTGDEATFEVLNQRTLEKLFKMTQMMEIRWESVATLMGLDPGKETQDTTYMKHQNGLIDEVRSSLLLLDEQDQALFDEHIAPLMGGYVSEDDLDDPA